MSVLDMPDTADSVLRCKSLAKQVISPDGTLTILDGVDLDVARGEAVAILGASGSGKTTLLSLLAGLDTPTRGQIWLAGEELTAMDEDGRAALRARHVGFVFQAFHLLPGLTALENVMLPLELAGNTDPAAGARAAMTAVGLGTRLHHYPHKLSGGEQQRVAIARAFANRPAILFADEPTGNLDIRTGATIIDLLVDMNRDAGTTLVMVTHDESLAGRCRRRLVLANGHLEAQA